MRKELYLLNLSSIIKFLEISHLGVRERFSLQSFRPRRRAKRISLPTGQAGTAITDAKPGRHQNPST
jgi:hypothetical protein